MPFMPTPPRVSAATALIRYGSGLLRQPRRSTLHPQALNRMHFSARSGPRGEEFFSTKNLRYRGVALATVALGTGAFAFYSSNGNNDEHSPWIQNARNTADRAVQSFVEAISEAATELSSRLLPDLAFAGSFSSSSDTAANSINRPFVSAARGSPSSVPQPSAPADHDLMILTKKLIEVRNLLKTVNVQNSNLKLPSIVVVGSQSSGKSSVLEAIVGHEFLPKGNNMVTRRPIELTLIHNPNSSEEYSEFPQLGFGKITDFGKVQKTLTDLNLAVPDSECVSPVPIELRIYSPNVPDLTMVDLPGYIQIHNKNQPAILKEKIADLCESYIKDTNIILAVCAADVDLANSEALRASRKVDPLGTRTIGVITKMDLVDPERAVSILQNSDYPLKLGYVGVICKTKASSGPSQAVIRAEDAYFKANPIFRGSQVTVGTPTLRRRLMEVLEEQMGRGLHRVVDAVQAELDEARYQFKVQYDDRRVSPESYVAEVMDSVKGRFREFARTYGKQQVKEQVREMLEEKLLDLCADVYWSDAMQTDAFTKVCGDPIWVTRVDMVASQLAKSGVGRSSVQVVADTLLNTMDQICSEGVSKYHPSTRAKLMQFSNDLIRSKFNQTVDQVENTIRPFKMEVDCSEGEWKDAQKRAVALFDRKIAEAHTEINTIKSTLGRRKLRTLLKQIQTALRQQQDSGADTMDTTGIDPAQLALGQRYLHLTHHTSLLQRRHAAIRSRACSTTTPGKSCCPETFLSAVVEKLTHHAVLFISVELVNEFFFQIPRDMDAKLYYELSRQEIKEFAKENEAVAKHLEVQERKETLELVMQKLRGLSSRH